jgi:hypothetical protein
MTPIQKAALDFVGDVRTDRATGRIQRRDLREISEPMRQALIDLAMLEPPLIDVDGDRVFLTGAGQRARSLAVTGDWR